MPDLNVDNDLEGLHQELRNLATAIMRQDPPLDQRTKAIAEAKILALQQADQDAGREVRQGQRREQRPQLGHRGAGHRERDPPERN